MFTKARTLRTGLRLSGVQTHAASKETKSGLFEWTDGAYPAAYFAPVAESRLAAYDG